MLPESELEITNLCLSNKQTAGAGEGHGFSPAVTLNHDAGFSP
jgi:hypothetical protein